MIAKEKGKNIINILEKYFSEVYLWDDDVILVCCNIEEKGKKAVFVSFAFSQEDFGKWDTREIITRIFDTIGTICQMSQKN